MIFVAMPYSHKDNNVVLERYETLNRYLVKLFNDGLHPIAPVAIGHPIVSHGIPGSYDFWQTYARKLIAVSEEVHVLCLPGWLESTGLKDEMLTAIAFKKPLHYINCVSFETTHIETF